MKSVYQIERVVQDLLEQVDGSGQFRLRTPVDVVAIARHLGADVRYHPADEGEISGALYREAGGRSAIIGVNANHPETRQRFTIAHEIGHLQLHDDELHVDHQLSPGQHPGRQLTLRALRSRASSEARDPKEIEANRFAAALLMPVSLLAKDLKRYERALTELDVSRLARRYNVSAQAMAFRLEKLSVPVEHVQP